MHRWLRRVGLISLFVVVALLLAPTVVPPFLDRIYYRGPVSDHFDGEHFYNPDGGLPVVGARFAASFLWRVLTRHAREPWPTHVAVTPGYPPAAATACPARPARVVKNWARCVAHPDPRRMFATWIGHSTMLVQAGGINILTDPVYADRSGPWGLFGPRRVRAPGIAFDDLPHINVVLVSHDHYDHMDLATLTRLWARDRPLIVTSLGNDTILRGAGVPSVARDWGGRVPVRPGVDVIVERVHHWGTRWGSDRNRALWSGFTVTLRGGNLFFAGDTAWGDGSWPVAAAKDGPFRLAILPIGAIRPRDMMAPNHIDPAEAVAAFRRLGAAYAVGVHWGTFHLTEEAIDAPPMLLRAALARAHVPRDRFRAIEVGQPWEVPALRQ